MKINYIDFSDLESKFILRKNEEGIFEKGRSSINHKFGNAIVNTNFYYRNGELIKTMITDWKEKEEEYLPLILNYKSTQTRVDYMKSLTKNLEKDLEKFTPDFIKVKSKKTNSHGVLVIRFNVIGSDIEYALGYSKEKSDRFWIMTKPLFLIDELIEEKEALIVHLKKDIH